MAQWWVFLENDLFRRPQLTDVRCQLVNDWGSALSMQRLFLGK